MRSKFGADFVVFVVDMALKDSQEKVIVIQVQKTCIECPELKMLNGDTVKKIRNV